MSAKLKKLTVRIDEKLYEALKELVIKKFGPNYWGGLRAVVEEAIRLYLASHSLGRSDNVEIRPNNPPPRVHSVYIQVRSFLRDKGVYREASYGALASAIAYVRGADKRTIRKWIRLFLTYGCITHLGGEVYELH